MTEIRLPDPDCSAICENAMLDVCIETCAAEGNCVFFKLRRDLTLMDMPKYPDTSKKKWKARFVIQEAYTTKTIDHIQGIIYEHHAPTRRDHDFAGSVKVSQNFKKQNIQHGPATIATVLQNWPQPESAERRFVGVDQGSD